MPFLYCSSSFHVRRSSSQLSLLLLRPKSFFSLLPLVPKTAHEMGESFVTALFVWGGQIRYRASYIK